MHDDAELPGADVRVRLFGMVDVEGDQVDPSVKLRPLSRGLLARLTLVDPGRRLDTEDLAKALVIGVDPGAAVAPDKLSSARQQLRNAQWELRKRLGEADGGARLLGAGRRWVALEGAPSDYHEFLRAADGGERDRALAIASRGAFLAGIDDPWTAPHREAVEERLRALEPGDARATAAPAPGADATGDEAAHIPVVAARRSRPAARGRRIATVAAGATTVAIAVALGVALLDGEDRPALPDASRAPADVRADGAPVRLPSRPSARCEQVLSGAGPAEVTTIASAGTTVAQVKTYRAPRQRKVCAKLIKPAGTRLHGRLTHLALTLCGERNVCERDWHAYRIDAGPLVVPAPDGCVSWRVTMADTTGGWAVRDRVGRTGCS